jgi:hypothetical protein
VLVLSETVLSARNRIEVTVTGYLFGCDRLGVSRTEIQAGADGRDAEHDLSAI